MFSRYLCAFLLVAAFAFAVNAQEEPVDVEDVEDVEQRNPIVAIVARIIGRLFVGAARKCLTEAATQCKDHWKNPSAALNCAKDFLKANKGRCAVGK